MSDLKFEKKLERLMRQDFSAGTEAFHDELLGRCLAELDTDASALDAFENDDFRELSDSELGMLSAAGMTYTQGPGLNVHLPG